MQIDAQHLLNACQVGAAELCNEWLEQAEIEHPASTAHHLRRVCNLGDEGWRCGRRIQPLALLLHVGHHARILHQSGMALAQLLQQGRQVQACRRAGQRSVLWRVHSLRGACEIAHEFGSPAQVMMADGMLGADCDGAIQQVSGAMKLSHANRCQRNDIERLQVERRLGQDAHEGLFGLLNASGPEQPSGFL